MEDTQSLIDQQSKPVGYHTHNGIDAPRLDRYSFGNIPYQYNALEFDNSSVASTATIDWSKSNVQYVTLSADTTFTFVAPQPGMRCILHVAGAFTPTWPSTVRWSGSTTPTATATSGHKDIYSFVYSGKEGLYDGIQSANFATT